MFKRGLEKPLLKWLRKEAGKDWMRPDGIALMGPHFERKGVDFRFVVYFSDDRTQIITTENLKVSYLPYTRARFRAALRRLENAKDKK